MFASVSPPPRPPTRTASTQRAPPGPGLWREHISSPPGDARPAQGLWLEGEQRRRGSGRQCGQRVAALRCAIQALILCRRGRRTKQDGLAHPPPATRREPETQLRGRRACGGRGSPCPEPARHGSITGSWPNGPPGGGRPRGGLSISAPLCGQIKPQWPRSPNAGGGGGFNGVLVLTDNSEASGSCLLGPGLGCDQSLPAAGGRARPRAPSRLPDRAPVSRKILPGFIYLIALGRRRVMVRSAFSPRPPPRPLSEALLRGPRGLMQSHAA